MKSLEEQRKPNSSKKTGQLLLVVNILDGDSEAWYPIMFLDESSRNSFLIIDYPFAVIEVLA